MPPQTKISKQDIIDASLDLIREGGDAAINARSIATRLNCSTQPIFSNFSSMEELQAEVTRSAYELYLEFICREVESGKYPQYKAFGMAYIRFAREERQLFKLLYMCDRSGGELIPTEDFNASVQMIMSNNNISREKAELMHIEMWSCVHGIATMLATSFVELDWELISTILTDVYQGIRAKLSEKEDRS